jgi:hypothetical protein
MEEVRRAEDQELCGFVAHVDGTWRSRTVFGGELGDHDRREAAVDQVLREGLASLAERWTLRERATGDGEVVCIQEVNAVQVTVARGYYSLPGVPTLTITAEELASGAWELRR